MPNPNIVHLTNATFNEYIRSDTPILVDFYADWCGPCQRMIKVLPRLTEEFQEKVIIGKVNVDEEELLKKEYDVKSIPTFILFDEGRIVDRWSGVKTLLEIKRIVESNI